MDKFCNFSDQQIEQARQVSLVDYCQAKGIPLAGAPTNPHLEEMDSLVLFPENIVRQWHRYSTSEGGDAINFVEYYNHVNFQEAVRELLAPEFQTLTQKQASSPQLVKESFAYQNFEVAAFNKAKDYLVDIRKINPEIVDHLHRTGYLAQDQRNNIVFKWKNQLTKKICGANVQGTQITEGRSFKRLQKNSTPGYGFNLMNGSPDSLYFFESSIDLLSYCDLHKGKLSNKWFISMEGLKKNVVIQSLADFSKMNPAHQPPDIYLCVDNDRAGQEFYEKNFKNYDYIHYNAPKEKGVKDWNDVLVKRRSHNTYVTSNYKFTSYNAPSMGTPYVKSHSVNYGMSLDRDEYER